MDTNSLKSHTAKFIGALQHKGEKTGEAGQEGQKALVELRSLAKDAAKDGLNVDKVSDFVAAMMKKVGIKSGTIRPYKSALAGYMLATVDGKDIEAWKKDARGKAQPLSPAGAREYITQARETEAQRAEREAREELAAIRAAIMQRVNAIKDKDTLSELLESLPEAPAEDAVETQATRAERERAEAEAEAQRLLEEMASDGETQEEAATAQEA